MTKGGLPAILGHLRRAVPVDRGDSSGGDAELLGRFVDSRDGFAFELLVRRHAPLVWNVCRRILHDDANAEDAFQAVFLTLVRKAHTIGRPASVASWLHKVAYRVAIEARRQAARRAAREVPVMEHHLTRIDDDAAWGELAPVIDEEVCRLPEKYRAPVVLCYLQGRTNTEAARELGCPSGTVVTRLAWARRRLRKRLMQRGLSATAGLFSAILVERSEAAVVPAQLIDATIRESLRLAAGATAAAGAQAALHLSRAATRTFSGGQVKFAVVLASLAMVGGAAGLRGTSEPSIQAAPTASVRSEGVAARSEVSERVKIEPDHVEEPQPTSEDHSRKNKLLAFLQRADGVKNTMTFTTDDDDGAESRTLPVAADALITHNGTPVRLTDLKPGCTMKLFLSPDGSKVVIIRVKD